MLAFALPSRVEAQAASGAALTAAPRKIIDDAAVKIVAILARKQDPAEKRVSEIEAIAYELFDFTTMSKLVLARNWRNLSTQQRTDFVREFKRHLSGTYWKTLEDYRDQKVEVNGTRQEKNGDVTVRSTIEGERSEPIRLDYRMRSSSSKWMVIDVIIEGVSLVQNFRNQTQEIIGDVGIDGLIDRLRQKNAEKSG